MEHTPGPWTIDERLATEGGTCLHRYVSSIANPYTGEVSSHLCQSKREKPAVRLHPICEMSGATDGIQAERDIANARLIAASPEMYEALKELKEMATDLFIRGQKTTLQQCKLMDRIYKITTTVLAKAEGKKETA